MDCCHLSRTYVLEKRKHFRASTRVACHHGSRSQSTVTGQRRHPGQPAWRGQGRGGRGRAQPDTYIMVLEKVSMGKSHQSLHCRVLWGLLPVLLPNPYTTHQCIICNHAHVCVGVKTVLQIKHVVLHAEVHPNVAERYKSVIVNTPKDANA